VSVLKIRTATSSQVTTFVRIDADKKDLFVAMLYLSCAELAMWQLANEPTAVQRLVGISSASRPPWTCSTTPVRAAMLCNDSSRRRSRVRRHAPPLMPRKPGERVKTNRRRDVRTSEAGSDTGMSVGHQPLNGVDVRHVDPRLICQFR